MTVLAGVLVLVGLWALGFWLWGIGEILRDVVDSCLAGEEGKE